MTNAHRINAGQHPLTDGMKDFFLFVEDDTEEAGRLTVDVAARRIPAKFGLDPRRDVQVLAPMHRGPAGAGTLNGLLQQAVVDPECTLLSEVGDGRNSQGTSKMVGTLSVREDVSDNSVVLRYGDGEYTYPVIDSTVGDKGFDIGKLRSQTGLVTLDSGYGNTADKSAISYLGYGEGGILRYRGYPIEQLAERSSFLEVAYLLINGESADRRRAQRVPGEITQHTLLHEDVKNFYKGFPRDAHPMAMLSSVVSALSTFYQDNHNPFDERQRHLSTIRLLAKLPTIAAYAYKKSIGHPFVYPRNDLGYVENFLRMTFSVPAQEYEPDPVVVSALHKPPSCTRTTSRTARPPRCAWSAPSGEHVRLDLRRHPPCPVGPAARWRQPVGAGDARGHPGRRRRRRRLHPQGEEQGGRRPPDGLRPPGLQELRPARQDHQGRRARRAVRSRQVRRTAGHRAQAGGARALRRLLRLAQPLPERGLLHRPDLPGHGLPDPDVHGPVRHRPAAGLDRPVARDDQGAGFPASAAPARSTRAWW
ncbi:ATP-dependent RecD-like DNA helicase [Streptomyces hirsutus]